MIRLEKAYSVEEVLSLVPAELRRIVNKEDKKITRPDGNKFKKFSRRLIMFKSKGGADALFNFQPMCVKCNARKADKI